MKNGFFFLMSLSYGGIFVNLITWIFVLAHGAAYRKKKNQEEKAHFATFCCRSRQLCLGGCGGDLREKRALSQRRNVLDRVRREKRSLGQRGEERENARIES